MVITSCPLPQNEAERLNTLVSLQPEFTPLDGQFSADANSRLSERGALMGYPEYRVQVRTSDDPLRCRRPSRMEGWDPDRTASPDSL